MQSFLYYMPYAVLGAMTFPAILEATATPWSAAVGMAVALILAYLRLNLLPVALASHRERLCGGVGYGALPVVWNRPPAVPAKRAASNKAPPVAQYTRS